MTRSPLLEVTMMLVTAPLLLAATGEEQFSLSFTNTSHGANREDTAVRIRLISR